VIDVAEHSQAAGPSLQPTTAIDERPARRALAAQIVRLERKLAKLRAVSWPRSDLKLGAGLPGGRPRIPDLGDLELIRDALAQSVADAERELDQRHATEDAHRRLIEDMLRHPRRHRWARVGNADIGQPGCRHWHVVPQWGPIGIFANWWRVKISSGCPLAT
jgi:hypothetical protein